SWRSCLRPRSRREWVPGSFVRAYPRPHGKVKAGTHAEEPVERCAAQNLDEGQPVMLGQMEQTRAGDGCSLFDGSGRRFRVAKGHAVGDGHLVRKRDERVEE